MFQLGNSGKPKANMDSSAFFTFVLKQYTRYIYSYLTKHVLIDKPNVDVLNGRTFRNIKVQAYNLYMLIISKLL